MTKRQKEGQLDQEEKRIVKLMLAQGERNQDIQALLNLGRMFTVNSARITEVKQNVNQPQATVQELENFKFRKHSFDPQTGLNTVVDERLVRAREAMILAVQVFNSAALHFKTEVFLVLCNVAWTYLLHEHYERNGVKIIDKDGRSFLLSYMLKRNDCPLTGGQANNLKAISLLRDEVEHKLLGKSDLAWQGLFQACCLNFEEVLCRLFGSQVTLAKNLAFSLQFVKPDFHQLAQVSNHNLPPHIEALDARLQAMFSEAERLELSYQFRVVYTFDAATKGTANIEFVNPDSVKGKEVRNILVNYKSSDHVYPHKPSKICNLVSKKTGQSFTSHNHTQARLLYSVRPKTNLKNPDATDKTYCVYPPVHRDYTYSEKWVEKLIAAVNDLDEFAKIKSVKIV